MQFFISTKMFFIAYAFTIYLTIDSWLDSDWLIDWLIPDLIVTDWLIDWLIPDLIVIDGENMPPFFCKKLLEELSFFCVNNDMRCCCKRQLIIVGMPAEKKKPNFFTRTSYSYLFDGAVARRHVAGAVVIRVEAVRHGVNG